MAFGLITITLCVGYLGYLHATKDNDQQLYEAIDSEGEKNMRRKTSKWDWSHQICYISWTLLWEMAWAESTGSVYKIIVVIKYC